MANAVRTGTTIQQENAQLKSRGFAVGVLDTPAVKRTWYRADGLAIPNLPCDDYHRMRFIGRGWSLTPPPALNEDVAVAEQALADEAEDDAEEGSRIRRRKASPNETKNPSPDEVQE